MDFTLIKSRRKTVALEIAPDGALIVRAPKSYTEKQAKAFVEKNQAWIDKHLPKIQQKYQAMTAVSDKEILLAKKCLDGLARILIEKYGRMLRVYPKNIKITSAKKRFGSCATNNNVCFSYLLCFYPFDAIEYVVVHELCHIFHHNHSKSFHNLVEKTLPDAKKKEKLLKPENFSVDNLYANCEIFENWAVDKCF